MYIESDIINDCIKIFNENKDDYLDNLEIVDIIDDYYVTRLKMYQDRKNYMIEALENELVLLTNKAKYIQENLSGSIDLRKKKKEQIIAMLEQKGYDKIDNDEDYKYLVKMPMDSVTEESVEKLLKDKGNKEVELDNVKKTTINKMWINELDQLRVQYVEYKEETIVTIQESIIDSLSEGEIITKRYCITSNKKSPDLHLHSPFIVLVDKTPYLNLPLAKDNDIQQLYNQAILTIDDKLKKLSNP
mgnify:CR=1 FL=1